MRDKKFGSSFFGYKKQDVYEFIEKLAKDLEEQIKIKDNEINKLKAQNQEYQNKIDDLSKKFEDLENDRSHIADAIIKAEKKAKNIVEEAIREAEDKKIQLQGQIEIEKEKVEKVKEDLRTLRETAIKVIGDFEKQLLDMTDTPEPEEQSVSQEVEPEIVEVDTEEMIEE